MHMDVLGNRVAIVGTDGLCVVEIRMSGPVSAAEFSLSEIPIPREQVVATGNPQYPMYLRTAHFLTSTTGDSLILSFVETNLTGSYSQL
jgi:hypothetical protein